MDRFADQGIRTKQRPRPGNGSPGTTLRQVDSIRATCLRHFRITVDHDPGMSSDSTHEQRRQLFLFLRAQGFGPHLHQVDPTTNGCPDALRQLVPTGYQFKISDERQRLRME